MEHHNHGHKVMAYQRSPEGEQRRLAALRSPEVRAKMSAVKRGKKPANFEDAQQLAWAASRKTSLSYSGIHAWVKREWGAATSCDLCGKQNLSGRAVHWSNKDHKYTRDRADWMMACRSCHSKYDQKHNGVSFVSRALRTAIES